MSGERSNFRFFLLISKSNFATIFFEIVSTQATCIERWGSKQKKKRKFLRKCWLLKRIKRFIFASDTLWSFPDLGLSETKENDVNSMDTAWKFSKSFVEMALVKSPENRHYSNLSQILVVSTFWPIVVGPKYLFVACMLWERTWKKKEFFCCFQAISMKTPLVIIAAFY